jgi:hypothetical protein
MQHSPRVRETVRLSDSLQRQLTAYTLNAGMAGVGMLALAGSAEEKIIYTPVHKRVVRHIELDLNNDGTPDFRISCSTSGSGSRCGYGFRPPNPENWLSVKPLHRSNAVWSKSQPPFVSAIAKGKRIGGEGMFPPGDNVMAKCIEYSSSYCYGPWLRANGRYLGLKFVIKGKIHYGWARLSVDWTLGRAILTGYAYETVPDKPILTGETKGPNVITFEPASLGHLAAGASAWRVKRTATARSLEHHYFSGNVDLRKTLVPASRSLA